ncbi:MAG: UDP-N-acetylmuramoyl-tripeptide--D-alanyl-D-alanine ligase [Saprospiraceae bacterium]
MIFSDMQFVMLILAIAVFAVESFFRLRKELHICQLNSYFNSRYLQWVKKNYFSPDRYPVFAVLVSILLYWADFHLLAGIFWLLCFGYSIWKIRNTKQKKKLVFTARAKRLFIGSLFLYGLAAAMLLYLGGSYLWLWPIALLSFAFLTLSNILMSPVEGSINRGFYTRARELMFSNKNLKRIGITGSYGKTSTKYFIQRILSEKYNALMTPESYNTTIGVVLTINKYLKPFHQWFVAEMGAKNIGDIKEICELVKPQWGVLTAVGEQHLETFGSIENVCKTKFELIASLPPEGIAFLNGDDKRMRDYAQQFGVRKVFFGIDDNRNEYLAKGLQYSSRGTRFTIAKAGENLMEIETELLGKHNIYNVLAAIAVAIESGVSLEQIRYAARSLKSVPHRLELKRNPSGVIIIDDAFNSNPIGAGNAVEVLCAMQGGKKFIVTPGMIELGENEVMYNRDFGKQIAAGGVDVAILVGRNQTRPIQEGLKESGFAGQLLVVKNLDEALQNLWKIAKPGDIVLLENDLPDTFNE